MFTSFSPTAKTLANQLAAQLLGDADEGENVFDSWFRTACKVKLSAGGSQLVIADDLGYFFQKWMLLVTGRLEMSPVYFMNASARFDGSAIVMTGRDSEIVVPDAMTGEFIDEIASELRAQLAALAEIQPTSSADAEHYRKEYLSPLLEFVSKRGG